MSTCPALNYKPLGAVEVSTAGEVEHKVADANAARGPWKELGVAGRAELLEPIRDEFLARRDEIATTITGETGKPIPESLVEVEDYCDQITWFLDNAGTALADEVTKEDESSLHRVVYEPRGVAAVIAPWNFPFGMAVWGVFPNLIAGNPVVFKTSEETPLVGKKFEEIMLNHDLPKGVFAEVYGAGDVGQMLSHSNVDLLWFTGSTATGKSLYRTAASKFIPATLEMGGSNPSIVFDDADLDIATQFVYGERFQNNGQVCAATKRLIVHEAIADDLVDRLKTIIETRRIGNPLLDPAAEVGSLISQRQAKVAQAQLDDALVKGAVVLAQNEIPEGLAGAYFPPSMISQITRDMRVWHEEVFAPILPVVSFSTEEQAIRMANDTIYGLGARVISADVERAEAIAARIEAGTVEINSGSRWEPCNPFGGYKSSGLGRELGVHGLRELSQTKVVSRSK